MKGELTFLSQIRVEGGLKVSRRTGGWKTERGSSKQLLCCLRPINGKLSFLWRTREDGGANTSENRLDEPLMAMKQK